ncbi:putative movement and silencing protein [Staphylococcus phage APTC_SA_12]|nr:hypothetical protein [Staphylococcus phage 812]AZB50114.1 hypothetical protein [Staphylococcus phage 812h1]UKH47802.1 MAG: hypothetical protein [Staphylococcus phage RP2]UPO38736.1 hypothetical protein [Staphylococcus phage vB_SaS_GE1]UWV19865.1 putative movement and silencing protein [Staphylococcus phage APTC_SA_2]UWV20261.1 putative movement and silencing protein [Staphylococcus phage APTC_SA_4]UWV20436.1 putative movement and silencing protein [Staphylococcus phage APTC_SA_12]UWV20687
MTYVIRNFYIGSTVCTWIYEWMELRRLDKEWL